MTNKLKEKLRTKFRFGGGVTNLPTGGGVKAAFAVAVCVVIFTATPTGATVTDNLHSGLWALLGRATDPIDKNGTMKSQVNYLVENTDSVKTDVENAKYSIKTDVLDAKDSITNSINSRLTQIETSITQNFRSVSNGKKLLAGSIADEGITDASGNLVNRDKIYTFSELDDLLDKLGQKKYSDGIIFADGRENTNSVSYQKGIEFADGRVNEDSASYKKGMESGIIVRKGSGGIKYEYESNNGTWYYKPVYYGSPTDTTAGPTYGHWSFSCENREILLAVVSYSAGNFSTSDVTSGCHMLGSAISANSDSLSGIDISRPGGPATDENSLRGSSVGAYVYDNTLTVSIHTEMAHPYANCSFEYVIVYK